MTRHRESILTGKFSIGLVATGILVGSMCLAHTQPSDTANTAASKLERMPEMLETRFALSAIPPHLRDGATVLLLDPAKGYAVGRKGNNGISCLVIRSDWQFPTRPFRNDIYWAVGFDAEGAKTLMQDYLTTAELRAQGINSKRVNQEITKTFGTVGYPNPSRAGIAYMIAPIMRGVDDTNVPEPKTMNMPHYMIYAPGVSNADIGGKPLSQYPFMLSMSPGRDDFIIMLVGETEKAKILAEFKDLLADLCAYRDYLCTNASTRMELPTKTGTEGP